MEVEERSGGRSGRKWRRQKGKQHPGGVSAYRVPIIVEEIISAAKNAPKFFRVLHRGEIMGQKKIINK